MRLADYCSCGGALSVAGTDEDGELVQDLMARWQAAHSGPGHHSTTANEANLVRNNWRTRPSQVSA